MRSTHLKSRFFSNPRAFTLTELLVVISIIIILTGIGLTVGSAITRSMSIQKTKAIMANAEQIAEEYKTLLNARRTPNHLASDHPPVNDFYWSINENPPVVGHTFDTPGGVGLGTQLLGTSQKSDSAVYPDTPDDIKNQSIARFVWATIQPPAIRSLYDANLADSLSDSDPQIPAKGATPAMGFLDLHDGWGRKLIYVAYVKHLNNPTTGATFGTPNPNNDDDADDFLPSSNSYYFVSAGPDGKWGHVNARTITGGAAGELSQYLEAAESLPADDAAVRARLAEEASDNVYSSDVLKGD